MTTLRPSRALGPLALALFGLVAATPAVAGIFPTRYVLIEPADEAPSATRIVTRRVVRTIVPADDAKAAEPGPAPPPAPDAATTQTVTRRVVRTVVAADPPAEATDPPPQVLLVREVVPARRVRFVRVVAAPTAGVAVGPARCRLFGR